jgi:hypothetical protein
MSMPVLRLVADTFAPAFQEEFGWLLKENVRGLHLSFDDYWYAAAVRRLGPSTFIRFNEWPEWIERLGWEYHEAARRGKQASLGHELTRLFHERRHWFLNSEEWALRCRSMGYPPEAFPIVFRVIFREKGDP